MSLKLLLILICIIFLIQIVFIIIIIIVNVVNLVIFSEGNPRKQLREVKSFTCHRAIEPSRFVAPVRLELDMQRVGKPESKVDVLPPAEPLVQSDWGTVLLHLEVVRVEPEVISLTSCQGFPSGTRAGGLGVQVTADNLELTARGLAGS